MKNLNIEIIEKRVRSIITDLFGKNSSTIDGESPLTEFIEDFTSVASLNLINKLESEFNFEVDFVSDDIRYSFANINNISKYIRDRLEDNID